MRMYKKGRTKANIKGPRARETDLREVRCDAETACFDIGSLFVCLFSRQQSNRRAAVSLVRLRLRQRDLMRFAVSIIVIVSVSVGVLA